MSGAYCIRRGEQHCTQSFGENPEERGSLEDLFTDEI
jgi:hypothetical protein